MSTRHFTMPTPRFSARIKAKNEVPTVRAIQSQKAKFTAVAMKPVEKDQPGKRRKKSSSTGAEEKPKKTRGVRGKLRLMTEMPLDILFETFSHLELADLFNLTKASKALRDMLFSPSAISIWRSAFLNIEANPPPPDVPPGMDFVQYTKLLYGRNCSYCPSHNATFAHWAERIRLCKECLDKSIICPKTYSLAERTARSIVPLWTLRRPGIDKYDHWYYLKSDFEKALNTIRDLEEEPEAFRDYTTERKKETEERNKFALSCMRWESGLKKQRRGHLQKVRRQRMTDIAERLKELGWEKEVNRLGGWLNTLPGVDQPKPLTDRIWDNIRDDIIEAFEGIREERLKEERLQVLRRRIGTLRSALMDLPRTTDIVPDYADLCTMEPFQAMILNTPHEDILTKEQFAALLTDFSDIAADWRRSNIEHLFQLLPRPFDVSSLKLATVFFKCHWCTEPITYPRILKHACLVRCHSDVIEDDNEIQHACSPMLPWNFDGEQITFDDEASDFAREIITACGQDPECVTMSEMDTLDPRVECLCCAHPSRGRLVMGWKTALLHVLKTHYEDGFSGPRWKLINDEAVLALIETKEAKGMLHWRQPIVECSKCGMHLGRGAIQTHIAATHSEILPADVDKNIIIPVDSSLHQPPYPIKIPT